MKNYILKLAANQNRFLRLLFTLAGRPARFFEMQVLRLLKDDQIMLRVVRQIQKEKRCLMWPAEMAQIYISAQASARLPGDFAEVGVYKGGSAKLMALVKGDKRLSLFDTFIGLPELAASDGSILHQGQFGIDIAEVKQYLRDFKNIEFYPGLFPVTGEPVKNRVFAFVHLDVDLYKSTFEALEFFYPRMTPGGIILSHDYTMPLGVKSAFKDFFSDKKEIIIELSTSQCIVVKR